MSKITYRSFFKKPIFTIAANFYHCKMKKITDQKNNKTGQIAKLRNRINFFSQKSSNFFFIGTRGFL